MHHYNLISLLAWANIDSCYLCQTLLSYLERTFGNQLYPANYGDYRTEICWKSSVDPEKKDTLYFVITNPSLKRDTWNFTHYYRMDVWPAKSFPRHPDRPLTSGIKQLSLSDDQPQTNTQSPTSRSLALSWLTRCRANEGGRHRECNKRDMVYLPTRLLDVKHAQKSSQLRLVRPVQTPELFLNNREWMTLSHCWGAWGAKENPILLKNNLQEREQVGLKLTNIPKTFRDAIEIAIWLNSK